MELQEIRSVNQSQDWGVDQSRESISIDSVASFPVEITNGDRQAELSLSRSWIEIDPSTANPVSPLPPLERMRVEGSNFCSKVEDLGSRVSRRACGAATIATIMLIVGGVLLGTAPNDLSKNIGIGLLISGASTLGCYFCCCNVSSDSPAQTSI